MKKELRILLALLTMMTLIGTIFSGCANPAVTTTGTSATTTETAVQADPMGKYETPVTVHVVAGTDSTVKYREGESADNNVWISAYKDTLGIDIVYDWIADSAQYTTKLNLAISSGSLPDIFPVNGQQLSTLVENDAIQAIDQVYPSWGTELTQNIIGQDPVLFDLGKRDGLLYSLPNTGGGSLYDSPSILYIRSDWLKKLNLPEPTTMDDFMQIAEAFTNQDPDGNGQNDTFALALLKNLHWTDAGPGTGISGFGNLTGFANAYNAYPGIWIKDNSGKTVYGSVQPEMKVVLQKLQDMYKANMLDKEFAVKDMAKASEATSAGKCGMEFGQMWNPFYPLQFTLANDPNADWQPYPVPSGTGEPAKVAASYGLLTFWVVNKNFDHPEALVKMVNLFTEKGWGETADPNMMNGDGSTYVPFKYALAQAWPAMKNIDQHNAIVAALKSGDASKLNAEAKSVYDQITAWLPTKDPTNSGGWGANKIFGENATFDVINKYVADDLYMVNQYIGVPTPTMVDKEATLDAMELEVFTKIIMGESIDTFDKFVSDWHNLGGEQITAEMNP